jgi:cytochrome c5
MTIMTAKQNIIGLSAAIALTIGCVSVQAGSVPPASSKQNLSFKKDIDPIFKRTACYDCHSGEKKRPKAGLRVDSAEWVKKGAKGDPVVNPKDSSKGSLVLTISRVDEDDAMPPEGKGDPLTKEEIGLVRAWIEQGMKP